MPVPTDFEKLSIDYKAIGKRIKIARITRDISQKKLAEMLQVSFSHMSNIETGNAKVSLPLLVGIANALGVSAADFLCNNLYYAKNSYSRELIRLLSDCGEDEIRILVDLLSCAKDSLRKNQKLFKNFFPGSSG